MIQLSFEPAFDPYHCAYRVLRQLVFLDRRPINIARMKINDVYILEPRRCLEIRLAGALKSAAKSAAKCQLPTYGQRPSTQSLFSRMGPIQDAAIQTLVVHQMIDRAGFLRDYAVLTGKVLPGPLIDRIGVNNARDVNLMSFLLVTLEGIPFDGVKGLKDRTGLGEFRYDVV